MRAYPYHNKHTNMDYQPVIAAASEIVFEAKKTTVDDLVAFLEDKLEIDDEFRALIAEFKGSLKNDFTPTKGKKAATPKTKRAPSRYNIFIGEAMAKIKESSPGLSSKERMKEAIKMWKDQAPAKP